MHLVANQKSLVVPSSSTTCSALQSSTSHLPATHSNLESAVSLPLDMPMERVARQISILKPVL